MVPGSSLGLLHAGSVLCPCPHLPGLPNPSHIPSLGLSQSLSKVLNSDAQEQWGSSGGPHMAKVVSSSPGLYLQETEEGNL